MQVLSVIQLYKQKRLDSHQAWQFVGSILDPNSLTLRLYTLQFLTLVLREKNKNRTAGDKNMT